MKKPFDAEISILLPDGSVVREKFNIFDFDKEFLCMICSANGEDEYISMQSWSDHFAKHYIEHARTTKFRSGEVSTTGTVNTTLSTENAASMINTANILSPANRSFNAGNHVPISEDEMMLIAIEESLQEMKLAETLVKEVPIPLSNTPNGPVKYPPRKKKDN